jgi:hypothetical protein
MSPRISSLLLILLHALQRGDRTTIQKVSRNPDPQLQKVAETAADCISGEYKCLKTE